MPYQPCRLLTLFFLLVMLPCLFAYIANADEPAPVNHAPEVTMKSYTYKTVEGQKLQADVYSYNDQRVRPVIFWIHGGALIMGSRYINPFLQNWFVENGFVVVTFDYRLAPFVKMPDIYQDVTDAYQWAHENVRRLGNGDPDQIVVGGESAGGYLTLAVALSFKPKPPVIFSLSGYGNIIAPWYSEPSDFYLHNRPLQERETAYQALRAAPMDGGVRANFYYYTRQSGQWPTILVGHDPKTEPAAFAPYCPLQHVTPDFPPVIMTHATEDTDVPYSEAETMAAQLKKQGVDYQLITIKGSYHASSVIMPGIDAGGKTGKAIMAFLWNHLKAAPK